MTVHLTLVAMVPASTESTPTSATVNQDMEDQTADSTLMNVYQTHALMAATVLMKSIITAVTVVMAILVAIVNRMSTCVQTRIFVLIVLHVKIKDKVLTVCVSQAILVLTVVLISMTVRQIHVIMEVHVGIW